MRKRSSGRSCPSVRETPSAERGDLAAHGARAVEHEHPVAALHDRLQVHARRQRQHEGAAAGAVGLVGDHVDARRLGFRLAPVDGDVGVEAEGRIRGARLGRGVLARGSDRDHAVRGRRRVVFGRRRGARGSGVVDVDAPAAVRLLGDRRPRMRGQAERFDGVVGAQVQVEAEGAGDRLVGGPEGEFLLVDAALFERIEVAADAALQLRRLDVDEADSCVAVGADRPDGHVEGAVAVLLGEAGLAARLLLRLIGRAGLLLSPAPRPRPACRRSSR